MALTAVGISTREVSNNFPTSMVLDDQIFGMFIVTQHHLEARREIITAEGVDNDVRVLFHLLNWGLLDQEVMDRLRDGTTRAMRYSAAMGEWLWRLIDGNIAQVGGNPSNFFVETLIPPSRTTTTTMRLQH